MDEFLNAILLAAGINPTSLEKAEDVNIKNEAVNVAKLNKALYDAHIEQGFTKEESIDLAKAIISLGGRK